MYRTLLNIVWAIVTVLIIVVGLYFTFRLKGVQLSFKDIIRSFEKDSDSKVSVFETLSLSLGAKIGIGSLSGIALSIYIGGAGSIFWIWVISFLSAAICFAESVLGSIYKEKDPDGSYKGGPSYYLLKGLNKPKIAVVYALLIILAYICSFLPIQVNTIVKSINSVSSINDLVIVLILVLIYIVIIFGKKSKLYKFISAFVPVMGILYLGIGLIVLIKNFNLLGNVFRMIISEAFNFNSFFSGFLYTMIVGIQRGIFSNEAGVGTSAISSSLSNSQPIKQGFAQMSGVYITSFVICTITALIILLSDYQNLVFTNFNGIELTAYAFAFHFGHLGKVLLMIITCLFAFSTVISGYYYGESSLLFIFPQLSSKCNNYFKVGTVIFLILGALVSSNFIWNSVDLLVGFLSIINIGAVYLLREDVWYEYLYYKSALRKKSAK